MTDAPTPRSARLAGGSHRANPAPRRALPRVKPLGAEGELPGDGPELGYGLSPVRSPASGPGSSPDAQPATGRDLLIPNGSEQARRKARGSGTVPTVPSLADLMPPADQPRPKKHRDPEPLPAKIKHGKPKQGDKHADKLADKVADKHGDKHGAKAAEDGVIREVDLQVTLSKGLRKRLKVKAADLGLSPEAAVAQLVEVWVDG